MVELLVRTKFDGTGWSRKTIKTGIGDGLGRADEAGHVRGRAAAAGKPDVCSGYRCESILAAYMLRAGIELEREAGALPWRF